MKKLCSILLSFSLILSIIFSFNLQAIANENKAVQTDNSKLNSYSVSQIAQTVMGYNANFGYNYTAAFGSDNSASNHNACNYDTYVLPLSDLGLDVGDTVIFTNSHPSTDFLYMAVMLNSSWNKVSSSNWVWKNVNRTVTITNEMQYITFMVTNSYSDNNPFDKRDIPFNDFKMYKHSITDENEINYLYEWSRMIDYDRNLNLDYEIWCHNFDADYQRQHSYINKNMQDSLAFFDGFDLDLKTTSDGVRVCWYNNTVYNVPQNTYEQLKENYPDVMTYEEMLQFIKKSGKKIFANLNQNDIDTAKAYGVEEQVFLGTEEHTKAIIREPYNLYIFCQTSETYDLELYKINKESNKNFYINTDIYFKQQYGGDFFTDEQITELAEHDINIGLSFCMQNRITEFVRFCRTHNRDTLNKINHIVIESENSLQCLKAATRYAYGICEHDEVYTKNFIPSTCAAAGYTGDTHCRACGNFICKGSDIPQVTTVALQKTTIGYDWYYTGKQITPTITVKDSEGKALVRGTDYSLTYDSGRVEIGTYSIKVTFKGNYSGTKTFTFKIIEKPVNKWVKSGNRWWYRHADGSYTKNNWEKINGKWYHFDSAGWMQTGWLKVRGKWYYLNANGDMATGWKKVSNKWYYLNSSGAMLTGWQKIGGAWYCFNSSGAMYSSRWVGNYYVDASGKWIKTR